MFLYLILSAPPPILTSNCDAGAASPNIPPLFHIIEWQCPVGNVCRQYNPRERECALKGCTEKFNPCCHLMIFCSEECYHHSGLQEPWEAICETSDLSPKQLQAKIRKERYRATKKGKEQRQRESAKRYAKQKETRDSAKQPEDVVIPDQWDAPTTEKSCVAEPLMPPTPSCEPAIPEHPVSSDGKTHEPETAREVVPPPTLTIPSENELRQVKHRAILKSLFSGEPEPATVSPEEAIAIPVGVTPCYCKALGCNVVVFPRSPNTEKRFCSRDCMNSFRNTIQNLREAWKATRCPFLKLLLMLFKQL